MTTLVCFAFSSLALALFVKMRYGSLETAAHAWRGDAILCDLYEVAIAQPQPSQTVAFQLTNTSSQPIRLLGADSSCTCVMATGLPMDFAPGTRKTLEVRFKPKKLDVPIDESIRLFTNRANQQVISLIISADPTNDAKETSG